MSNREVIEQLRQQSQKEEAARGSSPTLPSAAADPSPPLELLPPIPALQELSGLPTWKGKKR